MQVEFKFSPLQKIKVSAYGLDYSGTVLRCEYDGHTKNYSVEYASDGKIEQRIFFEDQLHEFL